MCPTLKKLNSFVYEESYKHKVNLPNMPNWLTIHFGQCGEDIIIASLLKSYAFKNKLTISELTYCEIGGNHPIATSSTYLLNVEYGMSGVILEANPALIADLKKVRIDDRIIQAAVTANDEKLVLFTISHDSELSSVDHAFVASWPGGGGGVKEQIYVPSMRLSHVFEQFFSSRIPAYLSIDVEGLDLDLIQDLDLYKYRPYIIQMEPSDHYIENNSLQMVNHMEENDYILIAKTDVNLIFVDKHSI